MVERQIALVADFKNEETDAGEIVEDWKEMADGGASTSLRKKFIVANSDEGDPGAFIGRFILEDGPHALIEGMVLAGHAVGATKGWINLHTESWFALPFGLAVPVVASATKFSQSSFQFPRSSRADWNTTSLTCILFRSAFFFEERWPLR